MDSTSLIIKNLEQIRNKYCSAKEAETINQAIKRISDYNKTIENIIDDIKAKIVKMDFEVRTQALKFNLLKEGYDFEV